MKPWTPFILALVISILLNLFPLFMGFVIKAPGWGEAGWAFWFISVPASIVLLVVGLIISIILAVKKKNAGNG